MAIDGASQLGAYIGETYREQNVIDNNLSPENSEFVNTIEDDEGIIIGGTVKGYKWIFATDAFIIDHPIQGNLDSATYKLDGGYRTPTEVHFPLSYPILWDEGYKELLFEQSLV